MPGYLGDRTLVESPIVSSAQMREAEEAAFARGIGVETLMDQAGGGIAKAVRKFFPVPGTCAVYAGKGHNGGDALVAANELQKIGWRIDVHLAYPENELSELTRQKLRAIRDEKPEKEFSHLIGGLTPPPQEIILDGLLGLGAKPMIRQPIRECAEEINRRRREENTFVFAVDLPTGFEGDNAQRDPEDCIVADVTVSVGFAKHGLIVDEALDYVGRLEVVPLPDLTLPETAPNELLATSHSLAPLLPQRKFGAYKNQFGRVGIVAGSEGFLGAAILAAEGALRGGAGLVNIFVPRDLYSAVAALAPIEAMVRPIKSYKELFDQNVDVWAIGPGLG